LYIQKRLISNLQDCDFSLIYMIVHRTVITVTCSHYLDGIICIKRFHRTLRAQCLPYVLKARHAWALRCNTDSAKPGTDQLPKRQLIKLKGKLT